MISIDWLVISYEKAAGNLRESIRIKTRELLYLPIQLAAVDFMKSANG
jgi:hypothetical protein